MKQKQLIATHRALKLDMWFARQPLNAQSNSTMEKVIAFKIRLTQWADRADPHEVAPTFHHAPNVC